MRWPAPTSISMIPGQLLFTPILRFVYDSFRRKKLSLPSYRVPIGAGEDGQMLTEQLQPGQRFEYFRIEAFVIRTSMTSIYRATDLRTNQLVALKIPHPELECDPVFYNRFQREMFIGKKLHHPGVVRMFDNSEMSQLCIVTEWVEDGFLRQILARDGKL